MACVKIYILSLLCALAGTAASVGSSSVNEICKHSFMIKYFFVLCHLDAVGNWNMEDLAII